MIRLLRRKARLLLLDDDPAMQRLIATILRRNGYHVEVVSSGSQAIEKMARVKYDALLLDLMTPTEGGMTVVRHLKKTAPAMLQRVVLVTGSPEAVLKTVAPDVAAVVQKPFDTAELIATVERVTSQP
jgi:DNA-binding response OmpR family regulator